nr:DUF2812 domain-containing protein [uncultured Oscillibacter sp.]
MRKQKKRTLRPWELWNPGAIQQWLEDEAGRGWRLTGCGCWLATFRAMKPGTYRVRLQPQRPETPEARRERGEAYREMGWDCTAVIGGDENSDFEVYYCGDPTASELDTDPVAWIWAWEKPLRRSWLTGWFWLALILGVLALPVLLSGKPALECLLNLELYWLVWLLFLIFLAVVMVRRLWHLRRVRRQMAAGVLPPAGNWRRDRRWQRAITLLFLLTWVLMLFGNAVSAFRGSEPDTAGLPYTAPTSLVEGTDKAYWEFETDNYAWQSTALAAARTGSQFRGESGEHVRNAADRLRFELLAKALYRERKAEFLENRPGAVETVVENKAFDEAILLAGGDRQMLLIRKGTIVYALWVDFPADLGGSMENVAAELAAGGP